LRTPPSFCFKVQYTPHPVCLTDHAWFLRGLSTNKNHSVVPSPGRRSLLRARNLLFGDSTRTLFTTRRCYPPPNGPLSCHPELACCTPAGCATDAVRDLLFRAPTSNRSENPSVIPNPPLARGFCTQTRGVGEESAFLFGFLRFYFQVSCGLPAVLPCSPTSPPIPPTPSPSPDSPHSPPSIP
jgi:hypothetical protein